ncbi:hypothetical protein SALBM135S_04857 [Streptomyces alboniger]
MPEGADTPLSTMPLLDAVLSVGTDLDLHATLQHIVDSAARLTGAAYGTLGATGAAHRAPADVFVAGGPDRRSAGVPPAHDEAGGGVIRVPIHVHDEPFGDLLLAGKADGPFTEEDRQLLRVLASQAGIAIGNARLFEAARRRERWIEGAAAVTTALLTGGAAADALMTVADRARILADAAAGVVLQPTEAGGMRIVAAATDGEPHGWGASARGRPGGPAAAGPARSRPPHRGEEHNDLIGTTIEPGSAVLAQLLGGEPVFIDDSATDPRMTTHVRVRFGPSMMLPLQAGGRLIGTLALPRRRGAPAYTAAERLLATQFASQAALALVLADAQQTPAAPRRLRGPRPHRARPARPRCPAALRHGHDAGVDPPPGQIDPGGVHPRPRRGRAGVDHPGGPHGHLRPPAAARRRAHQLPRQGPARDGGCRRGPRPPAVGALRGPRRRPRHPARGRPFSPRCAARWPPRPAGPASPGSTWRSTRGRRCPTGGRACA